jgi:hypothetical protein
MIARAVLVLVVALSLAACGSAIEVNGERVQTVGRAPSGKVVEIWRSREFHSELREVPEPVVVEAMHASSMFFDEDVRALSSTITRALAELQADERVVVDAGDSAIHIYVADGELQIASFRTGMELSRHTSAIPASAVKTTLSPHPTPAPPPPPAPAPAPTPVPVASPPPPVVEPNEHLTEAEIRKRLAELDRLLAKHLITQTEYDQKRKALLDQL